MVLPVTFITPKPINAVPGSIPKMIFSVANCRIFQGVKSLWNKSKHFLVPAIKIAVTVTCILLILYQWKQRPLEFETVWSSLENLPWYIIPVMILCSLSSWLVESKKWLFLIREFWELRFRTSTRLSINFYVDSLLESVIQNLTAQAASYITPFRAGEFITKASFFPSNIRKEIAGRVWIGNLSQLFITVVLGLLGSHYILDTLHISFMIYMVVLLLFLLIVLFGIWVFRKWKITMIPARQLLVITSFSLLRYVFFAINWIIILKALDYTDSVVLIAQKTAVMYLLFSIIPVVQLLDIPVRWTAAAFVFSGSLMPNELIIIATTLVWFTNSVLPTTIGALLFPFNTFKLATE